MKKSVLSVLGQAVSAEKVLAAKELRRAVTPAEEKLWHQLRGSKSGFRFGRQQVISGFIVDFYCHSAGVVVEVDGDIHDLQQEADAARTEVLESRGLKLIRFRNEQVLSNPFPAVRQINELCRARKNAR